MHPNRRFDIYLTDSQLSILSAYEVSQVVDGGPSYLLLLKKGSASVVVVRSGNIGNQVGLRWANGEGYASLGISESVLQPTKA
jgi:hypothetical protein